MTQRTLTIAAKQADHLAMLIHQSNGAAMAARAALEAAQQTETAAGSVLASILRGHDVATGAELVSLEGDQLTIREPTEAS